MPKTCYYEILGVESSVNQEDLKKAYRKCALRWHPDKNMGNEEAHSQFLAVQEAYTILSDPHERSWYDKHKDQILNADTKEFACFNVYPYFTTTCFNGFGDEENSFYTVYRTVFENIAAEDEAVVGRGTIDTPSFGKSDSTYEEVVEAFYSYWSHYCTKITFAWVDEKVSREYGRKANRFIQRENQKKREKLKKERNEEIRNLVSFVRKRDKRVIAWRTKVQEEKIEKLQKVEEQRREKLLEKKRLNDNYEECDWSKFSTLVEELENVEKSINEHFNDSTDESEPEDAPKFNGFFCIVCGKLFQSEKAFQNHEGSKKHKQAVAQFSKNVE